MEFLSNFWERVKAGFTKKLLILIIIVLGLVLLLITVGVIKAHADPFLTCDAQAGVTQYRVIFDGGPEELSPAQADGSAWHDIGHLAVGNHTGTIEAGAQYTLNGETQPAWRWSTTVPFDLNVPAIPTVVGIGLSP